MPYCVLDPEYQILETSAGLMHQLAVLNCFYIFCRNNNLIPVLPRLILTAEHNGGKARLLRDYVNIPEEFVREIPIDVTFGNIKIYQNEISGKIAKSIRTHFPFVEKFKRVAENVVKDLPRPLLCIRVRRNDMLHNRSEVVQATSVENIQSVLKQHTYSGLYIMTDEKDLTHFDQIENKFMFNNFKELAELKAEDNYSLFCVENYIRDLSDIRISTFTDHVDTDYYHGYLCDVYGIH
jgi:hypothetical protein